ncbi:GerAB/ArcD/ProY family transporter [Paenibacillus crassostreae]|uniref:Spore gernimation protein n=1 Tax=Paenibacillus crassostreae TaxID=1763538 RepID=A0A162RH83_9BACL|nr:GerAB/ArcD/ProY family transporter [Paenibacillus crassostreae]AOZ93153.1 spore gernimation protein [Paenibacillus crassostreae]OAB71757.1 spore gernimation protein [Paenibacillus crassostreae]
MKEKLSQFHVTILLYMTQTGAIIITLPRLLAQHFGTNGWLSLILVSIIVSLNLFLISAVYRLGKGKSILDILEKSIPKFIIYPLYLALIFIFAILGCLVSKQYVLIFKMHAFPTTHPMVFKLVIDVVAYFLIIKSIYNIAKAATVFFWLIIWMIILLFYLYSDFEFSRLTPFIFREATFTTNGFFTILISFLGFELCLFLFPYTNKQTKLMKAAQVSNIMVTITYLYTAFMAFGFYGHAHLKNLQFPLLNILGYIQLPFLQGTENLLFGFMLFSIIITSGMYWWAAKEVTYRMFPINHKFLALILLSISYFISFIPDSLNEIDRWLTYLGYSEVVISFGLPIILILLLLVQRMRGNTHD